MLEITNPTEAELETVLQFAFQHLPPSDLDVQIGAMMKQYHSGQLDLSGVFQAKNNGDLVGAMYVQTRPDGSAMLWVPAWAPGFPPESMSQEPMFESLVQFCRTQNAFAAIAIADRDQQFDEKTFCSAGQFQFLSNMVNLSVVIPPVSDALNEYFTAKTQAVFESGAKHFGGTLQFVPLSDYSEDTSDRLKRLVKETYRNTLDFPDLMQIAPVEKVLQGYKANALFLPELWFFIQKEGNDVGVLLLTDLPPEQFELTYMGLLESARRRGFSQEIVRFAKETARRWNRLLLLTSVDANNIPACQAYLAQGFKAWDRKKVFVRFFGEG